KTIAPTQPSAIGSLSNFMHALSRAEYFPPATKIVATIGSIVANVLAHENHLEADPKWKKDLPKGGTAAFFARVVGDPKELSRIAKTLEMILSAVGVFFAEYKPWCAERARSLKEMRRFYNLSALPEQFNDYWKGEKKGVEAFFRII